MSATTSASPSASSASALSPPSSSPPLRYSFVAFATSQPSDVDPRTPPGLSASSGSTLRGNHHLHDSEPSRRTTGSFGNARTVTSPAMMAFAPSSGLDSSHFASLSRSSMSPPDRSYRPPSMANLQRRFSATAALGFAAVAERQAAAAASRRARIPRRLSAPPLPDSRAITPQTPSFKFDDEDGAGAMEGVETASALSSPVLPSAALDADVSMSSDNPVPELDASEARGDAAAGSTGGTSSGGGTFISLTPAQRGAIAQLLLASLAADSAATSAGRPAFQTSASFNYSTAHGRRETADRIRAAFAARPSVASEALSSNAAPNAAAAAAQLGLLAHRFQRAQSTSHGMSDSALAGARGAATVRRATLAANSCHRPIVSNSRVAAESSEDSSGDEGAGMRAARQAEAPPSRFVGGRSAVNIFRASVVRRDSAHISPFAVAEPTRSPRRQHVSWQDAVVVQSQRSAPGPSSQLHGGSMPQDWAAYYARQTEWAGAALEHEARRLSGGTDDGSSARRDSRVPGILRRTTADDAVGEPSAKRPRLDSTADDVAVSSRRNTDEGTMVIRDGRTPSLSVTRPSDDDHSASASPAPGLPHGSSNGLVGVLSNFVNLLEARQETCEGLESLARSARSLAEAPLMPTTQAPQGPALREPSTSEESE